jgi:hypothetical protein
MKHRFYMSAAALALFVCLSTAPLAIAAPQSRDDQFTVRDRIERVIKKVRRFFGGITSLDELPIPPRP